MSKRHNLARTDDKKSNHHLVEGGKLIAKSKFYLVPEFWKSKLFYENRHTKRNGYIYEKIGV